MYVKEVTYTDFDGNERTESFYFNLTKAELYKLESSVPGGLSAFLKKIIAEQNAPKIAEMLEELIRMSYGEKSADGRKFEKSDAIYDDFKSTEAYSVIYSEMIEDDGTAAANFVNGIMPKALVEAVQKEAANAENNIRPIS